MRSMRSLHCTLRDPFANVRSANAAFANVRSANAAFANVNLFANVRSANVNVRSVNAKRSVCECSVFFVFFLL